MSFVLVEHEFKPIKLKGRKVVPATISPLRKAELKTGEYIGVLTNSKVTLLNCDGFIHAPGFNEFAFLASNIPATLDEFACNVPDEEVFVPVENTINVYWVVINEIIRESWVNADFWIPSSFYHNEIFLGEGWFKLNKESNQAIIVNALTKVEFPIKVSAIRDSSIVCKCLSAYRLEHYTYGN